jgi:hypothetical protein
MRFFTMRQQRDDVRRLLSRYGNRDFLRLVRFGPRTESRGVFCRPVWIIPLDNGRPEFGAMFPALTKDMHPEWLCIVHHSPIESSPVWVAIDHEDQVQIVNCRVAHSTSLGLGFVLIGLHATEVIDPGPLAIHEFRREAADRVADQVETASGCR